MRIKYGHFALLPQTCDICGRRFIWERYSKRFREIGIGHDSFSFPICRSCTDTRRMEFIESLKKPKSKTAHWKRVADWGGENPRWYCSACGARTFVGFDGDIRNVDPQLCGWDYCPICGAEMEKAVNVDADDMGKN